MDRGYLFPGGWPSLIPEQWEVLCNCLDHSRNLKLNVISVRRGLCVPLASQCQGPSRALRIRVEGMNDGRGHVTPPHAFIPGVVAGNATRSYAPNSRGRETWNNLLLSIVLTLGRTWKALWSITKTWPEGKDEGTG